MIPEDVDCIVVGTGLTNAIVAAACSRIGKSVLHLDKNNYYGNEWASFTFQQLTDWIRDLEPDNASLKDVPQELLDKSRLFCIDLCPRLLYSDGPLVELLVKSNVSRYHEFKNNIRILSMVGNQIHVMPCQRSDVFNSPLLSNLLDKRRLMKFIELCVEHDPSAQGNSTPSEVVKNADKPIEEFLKERGLNETLRSYIINSIAMVEPGESTLKACDSIKRFMVATEKYGKSPFLFPLYGCGEFPQSFCRLSAVFGGIYRLNSRVSRVEINKSHSEQEEESEPSKSCRRCRVEIQDGAHFQSEFLVIEQAEALHMNLSTPIEDTSRVSRAILITNGSLAENAANMISFLRIGSAESANGNPIHVLELNSSVMVAPPGFNIVYLWTRSSGINPEVDLRGAIEAIYRELPQSQVVWSYFFQQMVGVHCVSRPAPQVFATESPYNDLDYEHSISEAERIFRHMYPDQEFLPRAPDPEEIISEAN